MYSKCCAKMVIFCVKKRDSRRSLPFSLTCRC
jgi:hypothetical protein